MKKLLLFLIILIVLGFIYLAYKISGPLSLSAPIRIDLPEQKDSIESQSEQLIIFIKHDTYSAEYKSIKTSHKDFNLLLKELQKITSLKPNQRIIIKAAKETGYEKVMDAMILLNEAGWVNIGLETSSSE